MVNADFNILNRAWQYKLIKPNEGLVDLGESVQSYQQIMCLEKVK